MYQIALKGDALQSSCIWFWIQKYDIFISWLKAESTSAVSACHLLFPIISLAEERNLPFFYAILFKIFNWNGKLINFIQTEFWQSMAVWIDSQLCKEARGEGLSCHVSSPKIIWTKSKKNAFFFVRHSLTQSCQIGAANCILLFSIWQTVQSTDKLVLKEQILMNSEADINLDIFFLKWIFFGANTNEYFKNLV